MIFSSSPRNVRRRERRKLNPEKSSQSSRAHNFRRKMKVISLLGGKCTRCGEDDWRVLQVNHLGGTSRKDPLRSGAPLHRAIVSGKLPLKGLELLCANCNVIYEYERGRLKGPSKFVKEVRKDDVHSLVS